MGVADERVRVGNRFLPGCAWSQSGHGIRRRSPQARASARLSRGGVIARLWPVFGDASRAAGWRRAVELRAGAGRVFYFACSGHKLVLLHGYVKKSRRAPKREIEMALRRMAEVLEVQ